METSCGVVLVNCGTVLLLQYPQGHWDLPKGHVEADDLNHEATVRRELLEETGIDDLTLHPGFTQRTAYTYRHKGRVREKEVHWYLGETDTLTVTLSHEHRGHLWLPWDQAIEFVTHDETRGVLSAALNAAPHLA